MEQMQFGKKMISDSYYDGKLTNRQIAYSIPVVAKDKSQVLSEIMKAIDLITSKQTHTVTITIISGKDFNLKRINKEYVTESKI